MILVIDVHGSHPTNSIERQLLGVGKRIQIKELVPCSHHNQRVGLVYLSQSKSWLSEPITTKELAPGTHHNQGVGSVHPSQSRILPSASIKIRVLAPGISTPLHTTGCSLLWLELFVQQQLHCTQAHSKVPQSPLTDHTGRDLTLHTNCSIKV